MKKNRKCVETYRFNFDASFRNGGSFSLDSASKLSMPISCSRLRVIRLPEPGGTQRARPAETVTDSSYASLAVFETPPAAAAAPEVTGRGILHQMASDVRRGDRWRARETLRNGWSAT
jgi:hypothetical protein